MLNDIRRSLSPNWSATIKPPPVVRGGGVFTRRRPSGFRERQLDTMRLDAIIDRQPAPIVDGRGEIIIGAAGTN